MGVVEGVGSGYGAVWLCCISPVLYSESVSPPCDGYTHALLPSIEQVKLLLYPYRGALYEFITSVGVWRMGVEFGFNTGCHFLLLFSVFAHAG